MNSRQTRKRISIPVAAAILAAVAISLSGVAPTQAGDAPRALRATWATSQQSDPGPDSKPSFGDPTGGHDQKEFRHQTVRYVMRATIGGDAVRLKLSNLHGTSPLTIGAASIGLRTIGKAIDPATLRYLTFAGNSQITIQPGDEAWTDPVPLYVYEFADVAVSLYVVSARGVYSGHRAAKNTAWFSARDSGDLTADFSGASLGWPAVSWLWAQELDVMSERRPVVVAIGDSITDGHVVAPEANSDWPALLARRLEGEAAVINAGINGNTLLRPGSAEYGRAIVDRFNSDALDVPGATHVVVFAGTNDIRRGATAAQVTGGLGELASRARERGIRVFVGTITPRDDQPFGWEPARHNPVRHQVNNWIRTSGAFDGILDFDAVTRDPNNSDFLRVDYDSGDRLHPNTTGHKAIAESVNLGLLR